ncbi:MAG: bifunctional hydroxymethylpyrimidine kinase/phosphomethylpyrimidine kinase [Devosia sp.]|uniref:PfkB family carbohydrate kinase n=1 Tax=Devosia sp. TaxID=1871048 RepID=UPI001AC95C54|nr:PfkB family carbohydrate kinase [Devosia sp.]MBN9316268.1 bifunctional hydroxymethylpyrimidine kinase/phosphomethylpyrimidine kinase [Devosia sp.]
MVGRVVVFGSLHYDITVQAGQWPRQGETAVGSAWAPKLGGKGRNQAVAAARAGAVTAMIGAVGQDDFGRELLADLGSRGIDCARVRVSDAAGSGMSVALFDETGDYRAVIVSGANLTLGAADAPPQGYFSAADVVVLQNEVPEAANTLVAQAARAAGARVILNAAPARAIGADLAGAVDVLVVNAVEAAAMAEVAEPATLEQARAAAGSLALRFPAAVVTVGGAGLAHASGVASFSLPGERVAVVSTHGAGDAFVGTLAARLAAGAEMRAALEAANHAAAQLVAGVAPA